MCVCVPVRRFIKKLLFVWVHMVCMGTHGLYEELCRHIGWEGKSDVLCV